MTKVSKKVPRKKASRQLLYIVLSFAIGLAGITSLAYFLCLDKRTSVRRLSAADLSL